MALKSEAVATGQEGEAEPYGLELVWESRATWLMHSTWLSEELAWSARWTSACRSGEVAVKPRRSR